MSARSTIRTRRREAGIALLISIFILLLISVVAIALIVASGTESSLAGNYRSATGVYYAALAGLEEARGRLSAKNANSFTNTASPGFLPSPLLIGSARYVLNPGPADGNVLTAYPDNEYSTEFGAAPSDTKTTASIWTSSPLNTSLNLPSPLYKWVRINAISEVSMGRQVAPYDGHTADPAKPIFYDGAQLTVSNTGAQVLEITALAVMPNGSQNSQKLVQYLAAPAPLNLTFNAALTLDGKNMQPNVQFTVPNSGNFSIRGNDQYSAGSCNPGPGVVDAVGYTDPSDSTITSAIQASPPSQDRRGNYMNGMASTPDVNYETLSPNLQTVAGLNALVQTITQSADVVINGNATQANLPSGMSASNPMTIVINGDLTLNSWHGTGYGLLLVTGTFTFDPDATWNGIVLIIGTGKLYSHQGGSGQLNGAVFLAQTVDSSGNPLSSLGSPNFDFTSSSGSNGIYYSSCWIQAAMPNSGYKILSFHEIAQ
jgi:Tfp pilus assembly protein PilX